MKNLFERASSYWVRYDAYELRERQNGTLYVTPAKDARPKVYNPLADPEKLVLDALNVGMLAMGRKAPEVIQKGVMDFVNTYGLLGFMTALPTTSSFMDYEAVYLPKNSYIREESMQTKDYLDYDRMTVEQRNTMQMGMTAFGGNAPTNHIALYEKPTIVWDFHSLMLGIHMMFSFLLTDENHPMKLCRHCHKVFIAKKPYAEFCSTKCRNSFQKK